MVGKQGGQQYDGTKNNLGEDTKKILKRLHRGWRGAK
jgi:hypothetical protein